MLGVGAVRVVRGVFWDILAGRGVGVVLGVYSDSFVIREMAEEVTGSLGASLN